MQDRDRFTPEEYFEWEATQQLRYEYFDGEVFAMTGGSLAHADIVLNIASILKQHLQRRCKVRNSDAKIGISDDGPFIYPDISVTCDDSPAGTLRERDRAARQFSRYPCLIIEVLSPGTEAYDRGRKFAIYRRLETLKEYVLVRSETKTIEVFRRNEVGTWTFIPYGEGDRVELTSVNLVVSVDAIYEDVVF